MKRNRRWLFLLTGHTDALKATALIFGRSNSNKTATSTSSTTTTTTTTSTTTISPADVDETGNEEAGEEFDEDGVTKPPLTGIPQIDYVWDPNLPRELNGYNLSTYPFLNSVPDNEDIDFKCDGLHDGFYASIKYSCQLYHHCVYGIRHDFLCANFTAFDQKSFICHFVSEVNCKASAKYWFRNEALYKATTTTSTTTTTQAPPPTTTTQEPPRRPAPRRPLRNRRPQHEYYYDDEDYQDDYAEDRRRRPAGRQRNRRPEYDEYDARGYRDEEDDYTYEQRQTHRAKTRGNEEDDLEYDHRPHDRTRNNRNRPNENRRYNDNDRRGFDDRRYDYEDRRTHHEGRLGADGEKRKMKDRRPAMIDDRRTPIDERRSSVDDRKAGTDDRRSSSFDDRRSYNDDRRTMIEDRRSPSYDEDRRGGSDVRRPFTEDKRPLTEERRIENRRPITERRRLNSERRPPPIDDEYDQPRKYPDPEEEEEEDIPSRGNKRPAAEVKPEIVPKVRASGATSTIFNKPRAPPRINRPVPINEKKKFEYIPSKGERGGLAAGEPAIEDEVYDDEYDYEAEPEKFEPASKDEKTDDKNLPHASSQGNLAPLNYRNDSPVNQQESYQNEKLNEDDFDSDGRMTFKPQRSAGQKTEPMQQQQRHGQNENYSSEARSRNTANKNQLLNKPAIDYSREILAPETAEKAKVSEEEGQEYEKEDFNTNPGTNDQSPTDPLSTSYPSDFIASNERITDNYSDHKHVSHDQVPIRVLQADVKKSSGEFNFANQYKNNAHRLSPAPNLRPLLPVTPEYSKPLNVESAEKEISVIPNKPNITPPPEIKPSGFKPVNHDASTFYETDTESSRNNRPYVRIMKRPFLPSRGGSPYLPRGLKPLGGGASVNVNTEYSTGNTPIDMGSSTISGSRLLEHSPPILRTNFHNGIPVPSPVQAGPRTTQQPQIESPRSPLDEIYNSDYDVTLNDALNPTLKPITQSHDRESSFSYALGKYDRSNPYARSDISYSPSQYRSTAIQPPPPQVPASLQRRHQQQPQPQPQQQHQRQQQPQQPQQPQQLQPQQPQQQQQYYDDEYEY